MCLAQSECSVRGHFVARQLNPRDSGVKRTLCVHQDSLLSLPSCPFLPLGWPKSSFSFLCKNKRHIFHFHQELYWTIYLPFCSTTFCHFSGNFKIPSSQYFLFFWAKNCSKCLLQSSRELKFFPLREFCKGQNKWKAEDVMSGEYSRWIRTSQSSCNGFCLVIKETCGLVLSCWKIMCFLLINSEWCSSSAAYSWPN